MSKKLFSFGYIQLLHQAIRDPLAWSYIARRLSLSLQNIGIAHECILDIISILQQFETPKCEEIDVGSDLLNFQKKWRRHLDRVYFSDYESLRFPFLKTNVFDAIQSDYNLGSCLDVGCGRGCLSGQILKQGFANKVVGIDQANFESEWRERTIESSTANLSFAMVPIDGLRIWLETQQLFDTFLMCYVLHHSNEYWTVRTLLDIQQAMTKKSRLIIVEDSFFSTAEAKHDPFHIVPLWISLCSTSKIYTTTSAYHIQTVLDFVAVQFLANFNEVDMSCNYKTSEDWIEMFKKLNFNICTSEYIGFPNNRDIDVPQSFFVLSI